VKEEALNSAAKSERHYNKDKIIRERTLVNDHIPLKHTSNLQLFFDGNEIKLAMMTPNNKKLWQYWNYDRNQQVFVSLLN
ncbi:PilZ domain-containing protein, partial [Vibrio parahaemolyticus]|nr:PilZ domain-containing protein [Vibrio parahaemolyticus]